MNKHIIGYMTLVVGIGIVAAAGCRRQSESDSSEAAGVGERTVDAARETGVAVKDFTGRVIERTGEGLEKAGESMERTGAGMQTDPADTNE